MCVCVCGGGGGEWGKKPFWPPSFNPYHQYAPLHYQELCHMWFEIFSIPDPYRRLSPLTELQGGLPYSGRASKITIPAALCKFVLVVLGL